MLGKIVFYVSLISNILPFIGGVYYYKKFKKDRVQFSFFLYSIFIILMQVINSYLANFQHNTIWFFELSLFLEIAFFYWFYNLWVNYKPWFKITTLSVFLFISFLLVERYLINHNDKDVNYAFPIMIIYFIVQSSMAIIKTFEISETEFNKNYIFWISFARLFYYMAILPFTIFAFIDGFLDGEVKEVYRQADSYVNSFANIILNTLFLYSFKCRN